jgi:two-component system sensor histidine kinase/response regulator
MLKTKAWSKIHREYRHVIVAVIPEFDLPGHLLRWRGNMKDVHRVRSTEKNLRDTLTRQQLILSSSRIGLFRLNFATETVEIDEHIAYLLSVKGELSSCSYAEFITYVEVSDRDNVRRLIALSKQTGDPFQAEFRVRRSGSSPRHLVWSGKIVHDDIDSATYLLGAGWDITGTKPAAEDRARLHALEKQQQEQAEFVGSICHELRNPLTGITGFLDKMNETLDELRTICSAASSSKGPFGVSFATVEHLQSERR